MKELGLQFGAGGQKRVIEGGGTLKQCSLTVQKEPSLRCSGKVENVGREEQLNTSGKDLA